MPVSEVCKLVQERSGLLLALVTHVPDLVLSEEFWRCRVQLEAYHGILDFLKLETPAAPAPRKWIPYLIDSGVEGLAIPVVERFASETVDLFLHRA